MDFKERVPFGRTGLMVSRMGLASGYGVPTAAIEKAFHEYGVNYLWLSVLMPRHIVPAILNLAPRHRDELCIVLAWPASASFFLQRYVERWLKKLKIEQADLVVLQGQDKPPGQKLADRVQRLKESGRARFVGMSSHERPLFGKIARGEMKVPVDFFQIRYNAVHTALDIANGQNKVYLVEKEPSIGGHMIQLGRTFPTLDCSESILTPKMSDVGHHPFIELLSLSEVEEVSGSIGNFKVKVRKKARYVDEQVCWVWDLRREVSPQDR